MDFSQLILANHSYFRSSFLEKDKGKAQARKGRAQANEDMVFQPPQVDILGASVVLTEVMAEDFQQLIEVNNHYFIGKETDKPQAHNDKFQSHAATTVDSSKDQVDSLQDVVNILMVGNLVHLDATEDRNMENPCCDPPQQLNLDLDPVTSRSNMTLMDRIPVRGTKFRRMRAWNNHQIPSWKFFGY